MAAIQTSCLCPPKQNSKIILIKYFGRIAFARGVTRRPQGEILLYGVCALNVARSDTTSKNMVAWQRHVNVNKISSAKEQAGDEHVSWNKDEPFDENIPLASHGYGREQGEEEVSVAESEISKSLNSESNQAKKKEVARKLSWKENDITDMVDIVCNSDYYKKKNYLHEFKKLKKQ